MRLSNNIAHLSFSTKLSPSTLLEIPVLCPHLTSLEISNADLTDALLHSITAACPNIVHLDISTNYSYDLTDAGILSVVQNLKRLQSLNTLRIDLLPASLSNITTLVLDGVTCEKTLPIVAKYATNLKVLYIADYTRQSLKPLWSGCPSLRELYICFKPDMDEEE
eukprot:gene22595-25601_t